MKLDEFGCLVRQQNAPGDPGAVGDSCFDTADIFHILQQIGDTQYSHPIKLDAFIDADGKLQRHPRTAWPDDISSDQAHMFLIATREFRLGDFATIQIIKNNYRTSNGDKVSLGLRAEINGDTLLKNLLLIGQIILFWVPVRWCDGNNPTVRLGPIKLNLGYRHHAGDYRLFKHCLADAPIYIRRLVRKSTLKKMSRIYWEPEPNANWLLELEDRFVDECV